ncbi:MAG TPA: T9SS type A sorting domain-containing protein [Flavobacterium sp.]|jgi:uncharacterized repeat protein (TIGR01451 family)
MKKLLLFLFLSLSFGINAQTIQSINPNTGSSGETLQVTITGDNTTFSQISGTNGASFYNNMNQYFMASSYQFVSETEIIVNVTIPYFMPTGSYNVMIPNDSGGYYLANGFSVINTSNIITGNISFDIDGSGCDPSDVHMAGIKVNINDGTTDSFTYTDAAGDYFFYVPAGAFVVTPEPEMPYFTMSPVSATANFATQNSLTETHDFCLTPDGIHNDINVSILPIGPARPGFDAEYKLVYKNNGNQTLSGSINFTFDDTRLDLVSASPTPTSQTVGNLSWDYVNLLPFETRIIDVELNVNSPMETPAVNIGDILSFTATADPISGDDTPDDNSDYFEQVVVGSYDPNDKAVVEGSQVNISNVGDYLHYLIRFQNSGNFAAENVVVKDILASNLDVSTLEIISASHDYRSTLTDGNKLEIFFEGINLPPESTDEPGSHGFIAFKIKPTSDVVIGSVIENTAEIFFDFNFPIVTNTVATTFIVLGTNSFDFEDGILLFPNPAANTLNINFKSLSGIASVRILNQLGQLVKTIQDIDESRTNTIGVEDLTTGTYFVQITSSKGTSVKKLIKL